MRQSLAVLKSLDSILSVMAKYLRVLNRAGTASKITFNVLSIYGREVRVEMGRPSKDVVVCSSLCET